MVSIINALQFNPCPSTECFGNFVVNTDNCQCQCGITEEDCGVYEKFNTEDCQCVNSNCSYIEDCALGNIWNFDVCGCIKNECPGSDQCPEGQAFDSNCECQCTANENECDSFFDHFTCSCLSHDECEEEDCPLGWRWDDKICQCVAINCPETEECENNFGFDENCKCQCSLEQESCQPFEWFSKEDCACYPNFICDIVSECPLGESWNGSDDVCACVPNECKNIEPCGENHEYNQNCECMCALSQEICDADHPGSEFIECQCKKTEY
jgi:hypothetical protein